MKNTISYLLLGIILVLAMLPFSLAESHIGDIAQIYPQQSMLGKMFDIFNPPASVAEITLVDNTYSCAGTNCYAILDINPSEQMDTFDNSAFYWKFYDADGNEITIPYKTYIKEFSENGTVLWNEFDFNNYSFTEEKQIKIEGKIPKNSTIEWVVSFNGQELNQWDTWTAGPQIGTLGVIGHYFADNNYLYYPETDGVVSVMAKFDLRTGLNTQNFSLPAGFIADSTNLANGGGFNGTDAIVMRDDYHVADYVLATGTYVDLFNVGSGAGITGIDVIYTANLPTKFILISYLGIINVYNAAYSNTATYDISTICAASNENFRIGEGNGTDIYIVEYEAPYYVCHLNSTFQNMTDGFSTGSSHNYGITANTNNTLFINIGHQIVPFYTNNPAAPPLNIYTSVGYAPVITEGQTTTYSINITKLDGLASANATLIWNGSTKYVATLNAINSTAALLSYILTVPAVSTTNTINFSWMYYLNGTQYNTSNYSQTIQPFGISVNISTGCGLLNASRCFDFSDEKNFTNYTASIAYNFKFGLSNSTYKLLNGSLTDVSGFCICINSTESSSYNLGYGEIDYSKVGYVDRRYYLFNSTVLDSNTVNTTLYLLQNGAATSFMFNFIDNSLVPFSGDYAALLRWYPSINQYKTVDMGITDDKGNAIIRVETENADYRTALYYANGTLIKIANPTRFACLTSPCSYVPDMSTTASDYTSFFDVQTSIDFNYTTKIFTFVWNDPTGKTNSMRFYVYKETADNNLLICNSTGSGSVGILSCDTSAYSGTIVAQGYRTASPERPIIEKIVTTVITAFRSNTGLFITGLLVIVIFFIGIFSPIIAVLMGILALIPALFLGSINLEIFIAIGVVGGVVIHFMKRAA